MELDPLTLKLKGPNTYWEVNKANADPYGDYIFGLGVTGTGANPQVYFIDAQTKFPSSTTKNSVWKLDMASGKSTKVQALPKFAMGLGVPSPSVPNVYYYAEGKNVHIIQGGTVIQSQVFPTNIGGVEVVPDPSNPFLLAITRDAGKQYVYRISLDPATGKMIPPVVTNLIIKASSMSTLYPYSYTGIAFAQINLGGVERRVLYVTKDDGTIEPWDRIGIVDFDTGDILMEAFTTDLGIEVDPGTTWQSGTSGYLNYANPSGIDYVDGRLFISSLHYWNKGDKWPPKPEGKCISGKKWEDKNGDGKKDADEPYIAGWKITLYRWDGSSFVPYAETTTDSNGAYKFCNLPPCTYYKVVEDHPAGYIQTYPQAPGYWIIYLPVCTNQYDKNFGNKKELTGKIIIIKDGIGCMKLPSGMVGWWPGDGNSLDMYDGNPGSPATYAAGKVGEAFALADVDDVVQIPEASSNLDGFQKLSIDAWVKPDSLTPEYQTIVSKYDGSLNNGVSYWLGLRKDGRIQFSVYSAYTAAPFSSMGWTAITTAQGLAPTDKFTHVSGVWNGGQDLVIYVNGVAQAAPVTPNANGPGGASTADNSVPVTIGAVWREGPGSTMPGLLFTGLIDEVEIFGSALTKDEIQAIVAGGKCKGIFHYDAGQAPLAPFNLPVGSYRSFDPVPAGTYTVTETLPLPAGWEFKSLVCDDAETQYSDGGRTAKIDLDGGETVTCTYRNEKQKGKIVIKKEGEDCIFPPDGITGWWPGDDSMVDIADGNFGAAPPPPAQGPSYADGIVGRAFSLDGQNDAVLISDTQGGVPLDGYSQLTLDAWVKPDTVDPALQTIVAKYDYAKNDGYSYWLGILQGGAVRFAVYSGNTGGTWYGSYIDTAPGVITPGQAYHVAGVWDGGDLLTIYVNGVGFTPLVQYGNGGAMGPVLTQNDIPVTIGRVESSPFTTSPDFYFDGLIDEVEIFDHALTETQVKAIHAKGSGGKCKVGTDDFQFTGTGGLGNFPLKIGQSKTFENLDPGPYTVTESGLPPDWALDDIVCIDPTTNTVVADPSATIQLDDAETVVCTFVNKEEACAGKICGYKYNDLNGDGQMDAGDTGVAGVKIRLYPGTSTAVDSVDIGLVASETGHNLAGWGPVEPASSGGTYGGITDTRVAWTKGDARPASFTLAVSDVTKDHYLLAKVLDGIADDSFVVLVNNDPVYSFTGKNNPVSGGQNYFGDPAGTTEVWRTHGIFLAKEILVVGDNTVTVIPTGPAWSGFDTYGQLAVDTVELLKLDAPLAEVTTDSNGHYCFEDLAAGDYYVGEAVIPSGNVPSTHSILSRVTLACNEVKEPLNFFNTGLVRICGEKYRDVNANGLGDPDEGFGGVGMTLFTRSPNPADGVDIGDTGSETGHSLNGWGPIEPLTSGGTWGGIDDARATWIKGDGRGASFTLDAGAGSDHELILRVLDGQADDSFMVFVNGDPVYQYTAKNSPKPGDGNYFGDPPGPQELWRDHRIYVSGTGTLTISIAAMGDAWSGFDTYGQLGVDRADIYTLTQVSGGTAITGSDGKFCFFLTGIDLSQNPVFYIGETGLPDGSIPTTGSVSDPATQPYLFRNTEEQDVDKLFDLEIIEFCPPGDLDDYTTYTQGGWGGPGAPGQLLATNFAAVYPSGVEVGIPGAGGYSITFTSAAAVGTYLPAGGTAAPLSADHTDPVTTESGVFGGQVLALQINVDFSDAGVTEPGLGALIYVNPGDSLDGKTVQEILDVANSVLGGGTLPAGYTVSDLNDLVTHLNEAFDNGLTSGWAEQHLKEADGECISPVPDGAILKVDLTRDGNTVTQVLVEGPPGHWTTEFTDLEPGCYGYRVYYVLGIQEVILFQGTECLPVSITNPFTLKPCVALIGINKDGPEEAEPGDTVHYTYTVTNIGNEPLALVGVTDDKAGAASPVLAGGFNVGDLNKDGLLDLNEKWQFTADYQIPADYQGASLMNVATASGSGCGGATSSHDDHTLVITRTAQICGTKFSDDDGNGQQSGGEAGVENVQMKLFTIGTLSDRVEIGDAASEATHSMDGWGPVEPMTHGGGWGGIAPGTLRATWVPADAPWASFTLDAGSATSSLLKIRALDGGSDDSFLVEVDGTPVYVYRANPSTTEVWYVHDIYVAGSGVRTVKVTAIGEAGPYYDPYGQLGVDWAELYPLTATGHQATTGSDGNYCIQIPGLTPSQLPATFYVGEIAPQGRIPSTDSVRGPTTFTMDDFSWNVMGENFGNRLPSLLVVKKVVENHGVGTKVPSDFSFANNAGTLQKFEVDGQNEYPFYLGAFAVTEPAVSGYTTTYDGCAGSVAPGETKTCTVTNSWQTGSIELTKVWSGTAGRTTLQIGTSAGDDDVDSQQTGENGAAPLTTGANTVAAGTYYVSEINGLSGYDKVLECTKNGQAYVPGANGQVQVGAGDVVVCRFTNTRQTGKIELKKHWVGTAGSTTIRIGTTEGGHETDQETVNGQDGTTGQNTVDTGTYYLSETALAGYDAVITCLDQQQNPVAVGSDGDVQVTKDKEITCTITNTEEATVTVVKTAIGGDATFGYTGTIGDPFSLTTVSGTASKVFTFENLPADGVTKTVIESAPSAPWTFTSLLCVPAMPVTDRTATITVKPGDDITCTYTNTKQETVTKAFDLECVPGGFEEGDYYTYTQGGWGGQPAGQNVGQLLYENFDDVYPSGYVEVGIPGSGGFSMTFIGPGSIQKPPPNYLPAGGTAGPLDNDYVFDGVDPDPTSTGSGVFGGQVLALQLNVDFASAGKTGGDLGPLVLTGLTDEGGYHLSYFNGMTVSQVLALANQVLGGATPPAGITVGDLNQIADLLNNGFDNGIPTGWVQLHVVAPCVPAGATAYASLSGTGGTLSTALTQNGLHYTGSIADVVKGTYDVRFYYVLGGETTLCTTDDENLQLSITNYCLWPPAP
ncbi:MAG: hypothetical protein LUO91_02890 [Methanomicrobiales archaeon]|nr:hypothetical protein [Methanomicrobiales archaeon]